jgi:hypothetical protein
MPNQAFKNTYNLPLDSEGYCLDPETGDRICGAERNSGRPGPCKSPPVNHGNHRCRHHGGKSLKGMAATNYQGKSYSKYLPKAVLDDYNTALLDPELIQLKGEIALVEARMSLVFRQLGSGESKQTWRKVQDAKNDLMRALRLPTDDPQAAQAQAQALTILSEEIDKGSGDYALWIEMVDLIDAKRKLVESETRRMVAGKMYMTLDRFGLVFNALLRAVTSNVADRVTRGRIQDEWNRIMGGPREQMIDVESMDSAEVDA